MQSRRLLALTAVLGTLAACRGGAPAIDDALRNDLSLAAMNQPYNPQQYVSPMEQGYAYGQQPAAYPYQARAPQPVYGPTPVSQQRVIRRAPASAPASGPVYGSSSGPVVTNTARDATIGAIAGAAIGAVTSGRRDRLKGAVLGAAAGAVLGGVVGSKVDVKH
jgi:YMGG-like Gly-zipper